MHDGIATVIAKDIARGRGAKSFDDVEIQPHVTANLEEKGGGDDEFVKENDEQSTLSASLESRKSRKRTMMSIWNFEISHPNGRSHYGSIKDNPSSTSTFFIKK